MASKIVIMTVGLCAGATLALTGCSGGASSSSPAAPAGTSTSASSTSAASTSSSPSSPSSSASSTGSGDSGKPSKNAIIAGLTRFYVSKQGISQGKAKKFATCMVGKMYDKASAKSLRAMEAGDPSSLDRADAPLLTSSAGACAGALQ